MRGRELCVRPSLLALIFFSASVQFDGVNWWFTGVYGPQEDENKIQFLQELKDIRALCSGPWVLTGDFNMIYQAADKNNSNMNRALMGRFRSFRDDTILQKFLYMVVSIHGPMRGHPLLLCGLTEFSAALSGRTSILIHSCRVPPRGFLTIVLLSSNSAQIQKKRRFHFESFWPKRPGFLDAVTDNWNAHVSTSSPVECVFLKLQRLSKGLQRWSQRKVGNIRLQLDMAKEILHRLEIARYVRGLSPGEEWLRQKLKQHSLGLASLERTVARLRSRILYLREGGGQTLPSFTSKLATARKKNYC